MVKKVSKKEESCDCDSGCQCGWTHNKKMGGTPGVYCLGVIGAAVYFIGTATGFWMGVLGILKAIVWPAFMVYELLKFLGM